MFTASHLRSIRRRRSHAYQSPKLTWLQVRMCMVWLPVLLLVANRAQAGTRHEAALDVRLQGLVDELRAQLKVPEPVAVSLVDKNPLMASVEAVKGRDDAFVLSLETSFVETLTEDELRAVLAHELGHVWIFTHHPYLQTERLANDIAMRLVSRESLERVYNKVWKDGIKGNRERFLSEPKVQRVAVQRVAAQKVSAEPIQVAAAPR
jgi:Peptidase family M48